MAMRALRSGVAVIGLTSLAPATALRAQRAVPVLDEPRHHLVFENKFTHVLDVRVPAGDTTLFHRHDHPYMGTVIAGATLWDEPIGGGPSARTPGPPTAIGSVFDNWARPLPYTHRVSNTDTAGFHLVVAEWLASPGVDSAALPDTPTRKLLKDGQYARIYQVTLAAGASTESHRHAAPGLTIQVQAGDLRMDGSRAAGSGGTGAGAWWWRDAGHAHVLRNAGPTPIDVIEIDWR
jgi:quercetin dioxygenase-like cupin family protein